MTSVTPALSASATPASKKSKTSTTTASKTSVVPPFSKDPELNEPFSLIYKNKEKVWSHVYTMKTVCDFWRVMNNIHPHFESFADQYSEEKEANLFRDIIGLNKKVGLLQKNRCKKECDGVRMTLSEKVGFYNDLYGSWAIIRDYDARHRNVKENLLKEAYIQSENNVASNVLDLNFGSRENILGKVEGQGFLLHLFMSLVGLHFPDWVLGIFFHPTCAKNHTRCWRGFRIRFIVEKSQYLPELEQILWKQMEEYDETASTLYKHPVQPVSPDLLNILYPKPTQHSK